MLNDGLKAEIGKKAKMAFQYRDILNIWENTCAFFKYYFFSLK